MCVRMLNPKRNEYVMDPACGSGGFLLHAMDWCYPVGDNEQRELRKHKYASKYLWGIDFEQRAAKTSRALMLIAGDGHTNIFGPDVSSLDPRTWYESASGQALMQGLRQAKLTAKKIPEGETLKDEDKAWEYFDELKFDVVLANPPFAGEMKDRKMLARYELAKRALKRAGDDKAPKEERDVLFIERILKMLKSGGRAAIVLPQGKFNNSSLAFIREWILKKARLLAVVGLHPNTFKPHTGTKTSVLFVQKYTPEQLSQISEVHDKVASACPDYEANVKALLATYEAAADVPDDAIPEAIADLFAETFSEPEPEEGNDDSANNENGEGSSEGDNEVGGADEDRIAAAEEKLISTKAALVKARQKLIHLDSDAEALLQKEEQEVEALKKHWTGEKSALRLQIRNVQQACKVSVQKIRAARKDQQKALKAEINALEKQIPQAEAALKLLSNRGKLELILDDAELIGTLKERWIAADVAKRLDYPIFMAVSERGGKDNSGDYKYLLDEKGSLVEFPAGHPQEGQLVIDQDLVNYDLRPADLASVAKVADDQLRIAEAFVRFAQEQKFSFWESA
jgi:type I restriction enzyme M protein